jgi:hypothetical protein
MSEQWRPVVGEFVLVSRSDSPLFHARVERVTPTTVRVRGEAYRLPRRPIGRAREWTRRYLDSWFCLSPATKPQEELLAEHEAEQRRAVLRGLRRATATAAAACDDEDRLTRALAILGGGS